MLLNYGDIAPAEYLSTVVQLKINHTHPQIDGSDGDSYTDLLYKRLHCGAEILRWQTTARLPVLFVLGYDEIMQVCIDVRAAIPPTAKRSCEPTTVRSS
jgi:hypothetical protein